MEFSVLTSVALVAVAFFSYKQLVSVFDYFMSDAPIIRPSWTAILLGRSRSYKSLLTEAHEKVSQRQDAHRDVMVLIIFTVFEEGESVPYQFGDSYYPSLSVGAVSQASHGRAELHCCE